jgi:hypothetical protein
MVVQSLATAGTPPTFNNVASTDTFPTQPGYALIVRNTSASSINVTLDTPGNLGSGDAYPQKVVACGAGTGSGNVVPTEVWIPLSADYLDPSTGLGSVAYSATSGVKSALVAL